jgi:hypothetical protein
MVKISLTKYRTIIRENIRIVIRVFIRDIYVSCLLPIWEWPLHGTCLCTWPGRICSKQKSQVQGAFFCRPNKLPRIVHKPICFSSFSLAPCTGGSSHANSPQLLPYRNLSFLVDRSSEKAQYKLELHYLLVYWTEREGEIEKWVVAR